MARRRNARRENAGTAARRGGRLRWSWPKVGVRLADAAARHRSPSRLWGRWSLELSTSFRAACSFLPRFAGEGDRPKGGGRGDFRNAYLAAACNSILYAPTTMLRMVPLPRFTGGG